jgi:hypothetical protein
MANAAAARPSTPTTRPTIPRLRAVESSAEAVGAEFSELFALADAVVEALRPSAAALPVSLRTGAGFSGS